MAVETAADLRAMLADWDKAEWTPAAYPHPSSKTETIYGMFDNAYAEILDASTREPAFFCASEDVDGIAQNDNITVYKDQGATGVNYTVKNIEPDENENMTRLVLQKV